MNRKCLKFQLGDTLVSHIKSTGRMLLDDNATYQNKLYLTDLNNDFKGHYSVTSLYKYLRVLKNTDLQDVP